MRIVHFSDTYLPRRDGVITSIRTLAAEQTAAGSATLTIVPRHPDQPSDAPGLLRLRAVPVGPADIRVSPWLLRRGAAAGCLRAIANHQPDVLHIHTPGPVGLLGVVAAKHLNLPLIHTYHTDLHAYVEAYRIPVPALRAGVRLYAHRLAVPRPPWRAGSAPDDCRHARIGRQRRAALDAGNQLLFADAHAIVVPTSAVLDRIVLPVPDDRVFLVPTGVAARPTTAESVSSFRDRCGIQPDEPIILYVGRVNREKGLDLLIPAFARVLARHPGARLVLVGAVHQPRWLTTLLRAAGHAVTERIVLTGEQTPEVVASAYGAASLFAFPSRTDTQALVLQEAALAGVPVVMVDPVLHTAGPLGGHAVRADPAPDAFGCALAELLSDPARARAMSLAAAAHAARLTPAGYAAAIYDVYQYARAIAEHAHD